MLKKFRLPRKAKKAYKKMLPLCNIDGYLSRLWFNQACYDVYGPKAGKI